MSLIKVAATWSPGDWLTFSGLMLLHSQQSVHQDKKRGEVHALLNAYLQVHPLLPSPRLLQTLLWLFHRVGLGVSVHNRHVVNTFRPVLPEVTYQKVSLLFRSCPGLLSH